jgi:hypothetical protein
VYAPAVAAAHPALTAARLLRQIRTTSLAMPSGFRPDSPVDV